MLTPTDERRVGVSTGTALGVEVVTAADAKQKSAKHKAGKAVGP